MPKEERLRILGIDPGTHRLGYGVIDAQGQKLTVVAFGCIEPEKAADPADRLVAIEQALLEVIERTEPGAAAIEELFFAKNVTTAFRVAEARGVAMLTCRRAGLSVAEYKPNIIKQTVTGYGSADKKQIQKMVQMLLKLDMIPKPDDAADGLAVAICAAAHTKYVERRQ